MPLVINEFEVLSEPPAAQRAASDAPAASAQKPKLEPAQLEAPLHKLQQQALRAWAH